MIRAAVAAVIVALAPAQLPIPPLPPLPLPPLPPPPDVCTVPPLPEICLPPPPPPKNDDPPTFPAGASLTIKRPVPAKVELRWPAARDDVQLAGYRVFRDGIYVTRRSPEVRTIRLSLPCGGHRYRVEAVDGAELTASLSRRVVRQC